MWTRRELKEKAKLRLKANYWRAVLVGLILLLAAGGVGAGSSVSGRINALTSNHSSESTGQSSYDAGSDFAEGVIDGFNEGMEEELGELPDTTVSKEQSIIGIIFAVVIGMIIALIAFAIAFAIQCLLLNPLTIGCDRYYVTALSTEADIKEVCFTYDKGYKNGVKIMFFRDLYTFLWSLLFIIPGIIKSYEYSMIPYLLAENPDMDKETAFALSRQMMMGNKWKAFVLDLSFIAWYLLSILTCGILSVFYVNPYAYLTSAALYVTLRDGMNQDVEAQTPYVGTESAM